MAKTADRAMLSRLVDAYDRISEESLGMGDPEFHEIEEQLSEAIVESPDRAVSKKGGISTCLIRMGFLGKSSSSNPLNRRMWAIPKPSTSTKTRPEHERRGMGPFRPNERQTLKVSYEVLSDLEVLLSWVREANRQGTVS